MAEEHADMYYPSANFYADGMLVTVNSQENMLQRGMDPKPLILDYCKPQCIYWKEKLERCESMLEMVIKTNPTKSCIYPFRDWATCVEACVSISSILSNKMSTYNRPNLKCTINWKAHSASTVKSYEVDNNRWKKKCASAVTQSSQRMSEDQLCMYI